MKTLAGFLRGINVGGHHKVPMVELRDRLNEVGCNKVSHIKNDYQIQREIIFVFKSRWHSLEQQ